LALTSSPSNGTPVRAQFNVIASVTQEQSARSAASIGSMASLVQPENTRDRAAAREEHWSRNLKF